jgi:hypothetical protein
MLVGRITLERDVMGLKCHYCERSGVFHNEDGPAVEYGGENGMWYLNGVLHREGGPAIKSDNNETWAINGIMHNEDGPSYIRLSKRYGLSIEQKEWWVNGVRHREDGPAFITNYCGSTSCVEYLWYICGDFLTEEEFKLYYKCKFLELKVIEYYRRLSNMGKNNCSEIIELIMDELEDKFFFLYRDPLSG